MNGVYTFFKKIVIFQEVAGPNKTYPSILGLVGLSLHMKNTGKAATLIKQFSDVLGRSGTPVASVN